MFPRLYTQIERMIKSTVLDMQVARDIVRKAGLILDPIPPIGMPVSILSESWIVEENPEGFPGEITNDSAGILWDPDGGFPETLEFWPTGDPVYTTLVDLTGYTSMRNIVFISPFSPHPDLNVMVEASLDGSEWSSATDHDEEDWLYAGANANLGGWPETIDDAHGGLIASSWQRIAPEFRVEEVRIRWLFFVSPVSDSSPYDPASHEWGALKFGYADIQVG